MKRKFFEKINVLLYSVGIFLYLIYMREHQIFSYLILIMFVLSIIVLSLLTKGAKQEIKNKEFTMILIVKILLGCNVYVFRMHNLVYIFIVMYILISIVEMLRVKDKKIEDKYEKILVNRAYSNILAGFCISMGMLSYGYFKLLIIPLVCNVIEVYIKKENGTKKPILSSILLIISIFSISFSSMLVTTGNSSLFWQLDSFFFLIGVCSIIYLSKINKTY